MEPKGFSNLSDRGAMKVRFGPFTLDTGRQQVLAEGREIPLSPKAFAVLALLLKHRPDVIEKETIIARVWFGAHVSDASLTMVVAEIRKGLQDAAEDPRYIRTAHRRGYAFCGEAEDLEAQPAAGTVAAFWLLINDKRVILGPGETTVGRDPASGVWLDVSSVSWRHARVIIQGSAAAIQDLESTNGTHVGGRKISERTPLRHGDSIQFGEVKATFGASAGVAAARTERLRR
jgi:DNA-binding winged helix-turn-helix (wHTH) protein